MKIRIRLEGLDDFFHSLIVEDDTLREFDYNDYVRELYLCYVNQLMDCKGIMQRCALRGYLKYEY